MSLKVATAETQDAPQVDEKGNTENMAQRIFVALEFLSEEARRANLPHLAEVLNQALGNGLEAHVSRLRAALQARMFET
ncbi:MAG: hypothetical protein ACTHLA_13880 [Asticcacaulis sp.]|uniref:hypothetical protein n=1 Tax=Asticcacaulis sp. TaxID=1872648 RepID=UPI003F7C4CFA